MTLDQLKLYSQVTGRQLLKSQMTDMGTARIAYHAESKEFSRIVRENERLLKRD